MLELTEEESRIVTKEFNSSGKPEKIVAKIENDSVQRSSIQTLQPGQWLGDEVISYFYSMLAKRDEDLCQKDKSRKRSHFFKSFFITKLLNEGHNDPTMKGQYEYKNVKGFSKRVPGKDISDLDKLFFPINKSNNHWLCVVVFMNEKKIQVYDSMRSNGQLYLDSIFRYLQDENKKKHRAPPKLEEWKLIDCTEDTPQQNNGKCLIGRIDFGLVK